MMSRRGPKPAPTAAKVLSGTRKDRINQDEPTPPTGDPTPPESIEGEALKQWSHTVPILSAMGVVTVADGTALEVYCTTYATWLEASKALKKQGMFVKTPSGLIRPHPALKVQQESARDLMRILAEFGGTPSSRSRLKVSPAEKTVDPLAEFLST